MLGMLKGLGVTASHLFKRNVTVQYPEEQRELPERSRGLFELTVNPETATTKCISCGVCARNCPVNCIDITFQSWTDPMGYEKVPYTLFTRREPAPQELGPPVDLTYADEVLATTAADPGAMMDILKAFQEHYGYLPRRALHRVSQMRGLWLSEIYGIATFYGDFDLEPQGKTVVAVCDGAPCQISGGPALLAALEEKLGIGVGETTADGLVTLRRVSCPGTCALAPVVNVGQESYGPVSLPEVGQLVVGALAREAREL